MDGMKSALPFRRVFAAASLLVAATAAYAGDTLIPVGGLKWHLPSGAAIEDGILTIDVPPGESCMSCATAPLNLLQYPDGFIAEISASGENVSKASAPWLGLKFMVHYKDPEMGIDCYPDIMSRPTGTFSDMKLKLVDNFPGRVRQNPVLYLGLQGCSGKVVFDLSSLRLLKAEPAFAKVNQDYVVAYPKKMASPGSLRGFMLPHEPTEQDFKDMAAMGATLVRYQMTRNTRGFDESRHLDFAAYRDWLEGRLAKLDEILAWGERCCIEVVVDMHYTPGGVEKRGLRINYRQDCLDEFVESWRVIAARFKGRRGIYGYDLVNEPRHRDGIIADYWEVQRLAAEAIREIDPGATIIVESNGGSQPDSYAYLSPLAMDNVVYQVHLYNPGEYTFQGVFSQGAKNSFKGWPNPEEGWNREWIANNLRPVREFQRRHGARIFVGEFSAAAWVPGAENYLRDCIDLFREYGWDWTYHAFRESPCWDVEKEGPDINHMVPCADTPRKQALLEGLNR